MTSSDEASVVLSEDPSPKLVQGYQLSSYLFGFVSFLLIVIPDKTVTKRLATKFGGAAGFGLAAYISHLLKDATLQNRLSSDTYRRSNLGILGFSILGLAALPGEAAFWPSAAPAIVTASIMAAVRVFGAVVSYWGWREGVSNSQKTLGQALWQGCKDNVKGIRVQDKKKSLFYRNSLLIVQCCIFSNFMEGIFGLRYKDALSKTAMDISLQWSGVSRLFLISSILYSLKDASERDRLSGSTFIRMNYMIAAWAFLVGLGQSIIPYGFSFKKVEMFTFSILFFLKGYKGHKIKSSDDTPSNSIIAAAATEDTDDKKKEPSDDESDKKGDESNDDDNNDDDDDDDESS